jgi:uncharacterized protein
MSKEYKCRKVVRGSVTAEAIVCPERFSFLGDVDMETAEILTDSTGNKGQNIAGKVLIFKESKGSSGGCVVLLTLAKIGKAPAALITIKPADFNLTEGAILTHIPFVCQPVGDILNEIKTGDTVSVDADNGKIKV